MPNVGYVYRRLLETVSTGIFECNRKCKCKQSCLNRVAQHPLRVKLQVKADSQFLNNLFVRIKASCHGGQAVQSVCQIQVDTHLKTQVRIPARDYDIDRSESEMVGHYSNSRAQGDMCRLRYRTKCRRYQVRPMCLSIAIISPRSETALELISRAAPSVEAYHCSVGPDTGRNSGERRIKKYKKIRHC